jgi:hypothetical protein
MRFFTLFSTTVLCLPVGLASAQVQFATPVAFAVNVQSIRALTYDLNRDNVPDIVIAGGGAKQVAVLLSTAGDYAPAQYYATAGFCGGAVLGNANCDQYADLFVADYGSDSNGPGALLVLPGQAGGTFSAAVPQAVSGNPQDVAVGDFNGDSRADFATLDKLTGTLSVRLTTGSSCSPTYAPTASYATASGSLSAESVQLADFTHDGRPDVLVVNQASPSGQGLSLLPGQVGGTYGTAVGVATGAGFPEDVTIADLNHDTYPDVVVALADDNNLGVFYGQATAPFLGPRVSYAIPTTAQAVTVADFTGDQRPDVAAMLSNGEVRVWPGLANGGLGTSSVVRALAPTQQAQLLAADFNNDYKSDLALVSGGQVQVMLNSTSTPLATRAAQARRQLYPNPSTGTFNLGGAGREVQVRDALGRQVAVTLLPSGQVELAQPLAGLYLVEWLDVGAQPQQAKMEVR